MKPIKRPWVIPVVLTILLLVIGGFVLTFILTNEEPLSEEAIKTRVAALYNSEIGTFTKEGDFYNAELLKDGAVIEARIDAITGNVLSLKQVQAAPPPAPEILAEEEIRKQITEEYNGEIKNITFKENQAAPVYQVELSDKQTLFSLTIDAISGELISEVKKESSPPAQQVLISKERAIQIAQGRLRGEVEYIIYEQTDDGGYYLLEIDGEDDEATFQIHAISGKIISITYEDDDN